MNTNPKVRFAPSSTRRCAASLQAEWHVNGPPKLFNRQRSFERLPHDLFDGKPLRYQRLANGKYQLYSIGWNSRDDGGLMSSKENQKPEWKRDEGDWGWRGVPGK